MIKTQIQKNVKNVITNIRQDQPSQICGEKEIKMEIKYNHNESETRPYCPIAGTECPREHTDVTPILCITDWEQCKWYREQMEKRQNQTYGVPLGTAAMRSEDIERVFGE